MSSAHSIYIGTGIAPQGATKVGVETFYNEQGYKETYEYDYLPSEVVTEQTRSTFALEAPYTWDELKAYARSYVEALTFTTPEGSEQVFQVTVSHEGGNFIATAWGTVQYALDSLS